MFKLNTNVKTCFRARREFLKSEEEKAWAAANQDLIMKSVTY